MALPGDRAVDSPWALICRLLAFKDIALSNGRVHCSPCRTILFGKECCGVWGLSFRLF